MTKTILAISITAILVITAFALPIGVADAMGNFLDVKKTKVNTDSSEIEKAKFETKANIPTDGSAGAFGFGIIYANPIIPNDAVADVTVTHGGVRDSEVQVNSSDPVFHNHRVALVDLTADDKCPGLEVRDITFQQIGDVDIKKKKATMEDMPYYFAGTHSLSNAPINFLVDENVGNAVSFTIDPVDGTGNTNPNDIQAVCINDVQFTDKLKVKSVKD